MFMMACITCSIMMTVMPRDPDLRDVAHGFGHLGRGETGHQLVEQEQFRVAGKSSGHFEALLVGQREVAGRKVLELVRVDELEGLFGLLQGFAPNSCGGPSRTARRP